MIQHFLEQWFGLSDLAMEEDLFDVPLYREFAGLVGNRAAGSIDAKLPSSSWARVSVVSGMGFSFSCHGTFVPRLAGIDDADHD